MANQFVIQLPNRPGALADLSEILATRGVDLRAIGGGGIGESGHLIFKTSDDIATRAVLQEGAYEFIEGESLLVEVDDQPGGMARVARRLADAGVNLDMISTSSIRISCVISADEVRTAVRTLHEAFGLAEEAVTAEVSPAAPGVT